jgi:hypothetical protein
MPDINEIRRQESHVCMRSSLFACMPLCAMSSAKVHLLNEMHVQSIFIHVRLLSIKQTTRFLACITHAHNASTRHAVVRAG